MNGMPTYWSTLKSQIPWRKSRTASTLVTQTGITAGASTQTRPSNSQEYRRSGIFRAATTGLIVIVFFAAVLGGFTVTTIQAGRQRPVAPITSSSNHYIEVGCPKHDPRDCKPEEMVRVIKEYPKFHEIRKFRFEYLNKSEVDPFFNLPFCAGSRIPFRIPDVVIWMRLRWVPDQQCYMLANDDDSAWLIKVDEVTGLTDSEAMGIR